jgi:hypothetical protein
MSGRTWGGSLDYTSARHERVQASRPAIDFGYHRVHGFFLTYVTLNNGKRLLQRCFPAGLVCGHNDDLKTILAKKASCRYCSFHWSPVQSGCLS